MSETMPVEELVYEGTAQITGQTDFGITLEQVLSGEKPRPPAGLRVDFTFEGESTGPRIKGTVTGTDYVLTDGPGTAQLHQHAVFTTHDGARIAVFNEGRSNAEPQTSIFQQRVSVRLYTASEEYAWVNGRQFWQINQVDLSTGKVTFKAYLA